MVQSREKILACAIVDPSISIDKMRIEKSRRKSRKYVDYFAATASHASAGDMRAELLGSVVEGLRAMSSIISSVVL